jgi:shikimate dehydrogenase
MKWGIIGKKLGHSFSPQYFQDKFLSLGIQDTYDKLEIENLFNIKQEIGDLGWNGFNVTIPFKELIIPHLDEVTEDAKAIGAVNCVVIENNKWIGHNTDIGGFEKSILPFLENHFPRALIIGTGGASKAVAFVLERRNIETFKLSRHPEGKNQIGYDHIDENSLVHFPLIINTTPLGTWPSIQEKPAIPYDGITAHHYLFDLIYNPAETTFLLEGKQRGAQIQNGLRMLQIQADLSWEIWKNLSPAVSFE